MLKTLSTIISIIIHPIIIPTLACFLIFHSQPSYLILSDIVVNRLLLYTTLITIVFPLIFLAVFYGFRTFSKVKSSERNSRLFPLIIMGMTYYFAYRFFSVNSSHIIFNIFNTFLLSITIGVIIALVTNFFWKISLHMIGIGGIVALLYCLNVYFFSEQKMIFLISVALSGVVGSSRLYLKEHSFNQILVGFLLGFFSVAWIFLFA